MKTAFFYCLDHFVNPLKHTKGLRSTFTTLGNLVTVNAVYRVRQAFC